MTEILVQALYTSEYATSVGYSSGQTSFTQSMTIDELLAGVKRNLLVEEVYVQVKTDSGITLKKVGRFVVRFEADEDSELVSKSLEEEVPKDVPNPDVNKEEDVAITSSNPSPETPLPKKPSLLRRVVGG